MITLETRRLLLRPFSERELDAYVRICSDAEVMRYIGVGNVLSREEAWRSMAFLLGHWQLRGYGTWAAEDKQRATMVHGIDVVIYGRDR